jgi:hypothetical protein
MPAIAIGNQVCVKLGQILPRMDAYAGVAYASRAQPPVRSTLIRELIEEALEARIQALPAAKREEILRKVKAAAKGAA